MASQPLTSWPVEAIRPPAPRLTLVEAAASFSELEWSIIAMAERDGLASLRGSSRVAVLVGAIFGLKPANRLANDRLEALRRVAVLAWTYRWNVPESELRAFFAAGYAPLHYEQLQARIVAIRSSYARRTVR